MSEKIEFLKNVIIIYIEQAKSSKSADKWMKVNLVGETFELKRFEKAGRKSLKRAEISLN